MEANNTKNSESTFLLIGLLLLNLSQGLYFVGGWYLRIGSLAAGMCCLLYCCKLRLGNLSVPISTTLVVTALYGGGLALLTWYRDHAIWSSMSGLLGPSIAVCMFLVGVVLAASSRSTKPIFNQWLLAGLLLVAMVGLWRFLGQMKGLTAFGVGRGFGQDDLNPVSVAFNHVTLTMVCIVTVLFAESKVQKLLLLGVAGLALLVALSASSRGAILYFVIALFYLSYLCRSKIFTRKGIFSVLMFVAGGLLLFGIFYSQNYAFAGKVDLLVQRFTNTIFFLSGGAADNDNSTELRLGGWSYYLSTADQWLLLGQKGHAGYPHNQFIEWVVRFGVFGWPLLIASISSVVYLLTVVLKSQTARSWEFVLITTLFLMGYMQSMTSLSIEMNRILWLGFGYLTGHALLHKKIKRTTLTRIEHE